MGLKVTDISQLDSALVEAAQAELSQLLQERYPEVELTRGVMHDIVAFFAGGVSGGINQTEINRVLNSRSLLAIQEDPELADDELVDHVLSNHLITRRTGTRSRGEITIVVEGDTTVVISGNSLYTANGVEYRTDSSITARPPETVTNDPNDRVMSPRGDGTFEFSIPATAVNVGEVGNARAGAKFTPDIPPPRFVTAFATNDFIGGSSNEENDQFIDRMLAGIPAKVTAGRLNIEALVKDQVVFADVRHLSIIGFGDEEMSRDQHWIWPMSGGGRVDIYARNDVLPQTVTLKKTARLVQVGATSSTWQFSIDRNDVPGFYEVVGIRRTEDPTDVAGFQVISDTRGYHFDDDVWKPDIQTTEEAVYTRYQTTVIQFEDDLTKVTAELEAAGEQDYTITILAQPYIREMQEFLGGEDHRHLAADIVVKGAVPCFISINCDIIKANDETAPDLDEIKAALVNRVNSLGFVGILYASQLTDVIHDYLTGSQAVGKVDLLGRIRRIDGESVVIRGNSELRIPHTPSTLVTPRTTIFILYPDDIGLAVVNRDE